jgi:hypothetical protein
MRFEILEQDMIGTEQTLHALGPRQVQQMTPKHEPIKPMQNAQDELAQNRYKRIHGCFSS